MNQNEYNQQNEEDMWGDIVRGERGLSGRNIRRVGPNSSEEMQAEVEDRLRRGVKTPKEYLEGY